MQTKVITHQVKRPETWCFLEGRRGCRIAVRIWYMDDHGAQMNREALQDGAYLACHSPESILECGFPSAPVL